MKTMRLGRNDLCRCGSGKKFKKCCLARQPSPASPPLGRVPSLPRGGSPPAADGIPEYVIVKGKGRTHRSKLRPGEESELKDGSWATYRPDLLNGGSVHVKGKGWIPERELKPGDQYEYNGVWVTFQPERVIGTTEEHPFYVHGKGWTPLREISPGDIIRTEDGWVPVGSVENTGRYETVYNLRVEDHHTYFVGAPEWGFAVWAHNAYAGQIAGVTPEMQNYIARRMAMYARGQGDCNIHAAAITRMFNRNGIQAVTRSPTGPGQHALTLIPSQNMIVDVTARQFAGQSTATVQAALFRELTQTGVWTRQEYNDFIRSIWPHGGI